MVTTPRLVVLPAFHTAKWRSLTLALWFGVLVGLLSYLALLRFSSDPNWNLAYYPAGTAVWSGSNPYNVPDFASPPWLLLLLAPLSLMPSALGHLTFLLIGFIPIIYVARHLGASWVTLTALMLSWPVVSMALYTNVDGLVFLGLLLPTPVALFFLMLKPQLGAGIVIYLAVDTWRKKGMGTTCLYFAPITVAVVLSLLLTGWFHAATRLVSADWNLSFFPYSLPLGLFLAYKSLKSTNVGFALPVGPLLSPYVGTPSWSSVLLAFVGNERLCCVLSVASWVILRDGPVNLQILIASMTQH